MENNVILQGITVDQLMEKIDLLIKNQLANILEEIKPKSKYLSRKEACKILLISLPTLNDWSKQGKIISYRIGTRILYKSSEIENAISKRRFK